MDIGEESYSQNVRHKLQMFGLTLIISMVIFMLRLLYLKIKLVHCWWEVEPELHYWERWLSLFNITSTFNCMF